MAAWHISKPNLMVKACYYLLMLFKPCMFASSVREFGGLLYHDICMKKLMANLGNDIEDKHNTLY